MAGFIVNFDIYGNRSLEYRTDLPGLGRPGDLPGDNDLYTPEQAAAYGVYPSNTEATTEIQRQQYQADEAAQTAAFEALSAANAHAAIVRSLDTDTQAQQAQKAYAAAAEKTLRTVVEAPISAHLDYVDQARSAAVGAPVVESQRPAGQVALSTSPAPETSPLVTAGFFFALAKILLF